MTFWYDGDENDLVENHAEYMELTGDGGVRMDIDEMPRRKLQNMQGAIESAMEANSDE